MKRLFIILALCSAFILTGQEIGYIDYIDGFVDIHRDGEVLEIDNMFIGEPIYNYDLFETYDNATLIIRLTTVTNGAEISVESNTTFKLDSSNYAGESSTEIDLLTGSIAFKVQKLQGGEALNVNTYNTTMGVRGTQFQVHQTVDNSILVTCDEGKVAVSNDDGGAYAMPGQIVANNSDEPLKRYALDVEDIELYTQFWQNQREEVFKSSGGRFLKAYYEHYLSIKDEFLDAYEEMYSYKDKIQESIMKEEIYTTADLILLKKDVSASAIRLRASLSFMEHVFYSVKTMIRYRSLIKDTDQLARRVTVADFIEQFQDEAANIDKALNRSRHLLKLFVALSNAASGGLGSDPFVEDLMNSMMEGGVPTGNPPTGSFGGDF